MSKKEMQGGDLVGDGNVFFEKESLSVQGHKNFDGFLLLRFIQNYSRQVFRIVVRTMQVFFGFDVVFCKELSVRYFHVDRETIDVLVGFYCRTLFRDLLGIQIIYLELFLEGFQCSLF